MPSTKVLTLKELRHGSTPEDIHIKEINLMLRCISPTLLKGGYISIGEYDYCCLFKNIDKVIDLLKKAGYYVESKTLIDGFLDYQYMTISSKPLPPNYKISETPIYD